MKSEHVNTNTGYSVLLGLCLLISGCAEQDTGYFPLTEGYSWRYHMQLTNMEGTEQQKYYVSSMAARLIDNEITYIQHSLTGTEVLFHQSDVGISRVGFLIADGPSKKKVMDEHLILPSKLEEGTEWESVAETKLLTKDGPGRGNNMQIVAKVPLENRIESVNDVVKVPAGKFERCIRIHTKGFTFHKGGYLIGRTLVEIEQTDWYAPGVGLVKSVLQEKTTSDALSRGELIMELEAFSKP
jgi:hypothetical protein